MSSSLRGTKRERNDAEEAIPQSADSSLVIAERTINAIIETLNGSEPVTLGQIRKRIQRGLDALKAPPTDEQPSKKMKDKICSAIKNNDTASVERMLSKLSTADWEHAIDYAVKHGKTDSMALLASRI